MFENKIRRVVASVLCLCMLMTGIAFAETDDGAVRITRQPKGVTVEEGATVKLTVSAEGDGLEYAWYFKNKGASRFAKTESFKGTYYAVAMNDERDGRQVYCVVTDEYGNSAKSNTVTIGMIKPVRITSQPVSVAVTEGAAAEVTVKAEGEGLVYKWYYKNAGDSKFTRTYSFTGNAYSITMNSSRAGRQVYCVVSDEFGNTAKSNTVTLNMCRTQAKIIKQPVSVKAADGKTAKVTLTAEGEGLTYTWYFKNAGSSAFYKTSSFTGNTYSVSMNAERAGRQVYCVVRDKYGNNAHTHYYNVNDYFSK